MTSATARLHPLRVAASLGAAGVLARAVYTAAPRIAGVCPGGRELWLRPNHRGGEVTLLEGPAYAVAAGLGVAALPGVPGRLRAAGIVAVTGAAVFGAIDDLSPAPTGAHAAPTADKGFTGHLRALRRGRVTTGALKIAGIGVTGLAAAALALPARGPADGRAGRGVDILVSGALVAAAANLVNLLDLRPGRALKVVLMVGTGLATRSAPAAVAAGAAAGLVGPDLSERAMLGDTGANAAGALLGTAAVAVSGARTRAGVLAGLTALTLASEKVSFTRVIESTPGLAQLDRLGRRPR